jgi:hypothetical protein
MKTVAIALTLTAFYAAIATGKTDRNQLSRKSNLQQLGISAAVDYQILPGPNWIRGRALPLPDGFTPVSPLRAFSYTLSFSVSVPCSTSLTQSVMKSLLRKKNPTDNIKKPSPSSSTQHTRPPPPVETPLYARFASTKTAVQPLEGNRPVVSGPMPLGRPTRASVEADSRRKHEEENPSRRRLSRRVHTGPESQPGAREVQPSINRPSQDVPLDLPGPSMKAQVTCKSFFSLPIVHGRSPLLHHAIPDSVT